MVNVMYVVAGVLSVCAGVYALVWIASRAFYGGKLSAIRSAFRIKPRRK
jgi:hypothetical protein